jgi:hypothetical protein
MMPMMDTTTPLNSVFDRPARGAAPELAISPVRSSPFPLSDTALSEGASAAFLSAIAGQQTSAHDTLSRALFLFPF